LKTARADLPLFIYGHSLGGLVVIKLLLDKPELNISGCIITSPLLGLAKNMHFDWIKKQFMHYLGDHLSDFIVNSRVNPTALTKKTKYLHTIFDDRLMIPFMSVRMAKYIFEGLDFVKSKSSTFRYPIIIFHGKIDTVTNA
jgi:alpha-beta hydrolase superfamily lysophospholipase